MPLLACKTRHSRHSTPETDVQSQMTRVIFSRSPPCDTLILNPMRLRTLLLALFLCNAVIATCLFAVAQGEKSEGERKVVNRVMPEYPAIARSLHLSGVVRVEATVASNGSVKSVEVKGGHPLLVKAAQDAVYKWKWVAAPRETKEPVEVRFAPD